jgi:lipopolysaccharide transport system ATP-binding protein
MNAIKVEGLWKQYSIGNSRHETFAELLGHAMTAPFRRLCGTAEPQARSNAFWALRDVNFEVQQGEVIGIIGRNGAGKSTLLKTLSRITAPTRGRVAVRGRLASLLEVGTGFHGELSGRENIYLNGALLGMSRSDIRTKFDQIVTFAGVEKFVDMPVKRYSSGMYVRLAFSVAAHLDPDILVVDEVLAVGDAEFQAKCLGKLELSQKDGRTVIIVSHNMPLITQLCRRVVWLDEGAVLQDGEVHQVASSYLSSNRQMASNWQPIAPDGDAFRYRDVSIIASQGSSMESLSASQPIKVQFDYEVLADDLQGRIALQIRDQNDTPILSSANTDGLSALRRNWQSGKYIDTCEIPGHLLVPGTYYLTISEPSRNGEVIRENICSFKIGAVDSLVSRDGRAGVIAPQLAWRTTHVG